jgi:hypothetical protein
LGYDFKAIKFRRWAIDYANIQTWDGSNSYNVGDIVTYNNNNIVYVCVKEMMEEIAVMHRQLLTVYIEFLLCKMQQVLTKCIGRFIIQVFQFIYRIMSIRFL